MNGHHAGVMSAVASQIPSSVRRPALTRPTCPDTLSRGSHPLLPSGHREAARRGPPPELELPLPPGENNHVKDQKSDPGSCALASPSAELRSFAFHLPSYPEVGPDLEKRAQNWRERFIHTCLGPKVVNYCGYYFVSCP